MIAEIKYNTGVDHDVVYEDEYWKVQVERHSFGNIYHAEVYKWGPQAFRCIFQSWIKIITSELSPVYAYTDNEKLRKFCRMLGLQYHEDIITPHGQKISELYKLKEYTCQQQQHYLSQQ